MKNEVQETKPTAADPDREAINEAVAALRHHEARIEEAERGVNVLSEAIRKATNLVRERDSVRAEIDSLREQRRNLTADALLGKSDDAAIEESDRAIKAVEQRLADLTPRATDAEQALPVLEQRQSKAAEPIRALRGEIPALKYRILEAAGKTLLDEYGKRIVHAYEKYLETVALAQSMNHQLELAKTLADMNLPGIVPEIPGRFTFPGISLHGYRPENSFGMGQAEFEAAIERMRARLAEVGADI
jgi:chromosome segregation ATPase